ncbi:hypothetical protein DFQ30_002357, partial [Apophysomyces sp. BC1015]
MKDGFQSIEIEPHEGYLDFLGPITKSSTDVQVLTGHARFTLTKPTKIRSLTVKFKGFSRVCYKTVNTVDIHTPLLPKVKRQILGKKTLPAGEHVISWDIDIPNLFPRTVLIKRASIHYKVELCITVGLGKTLTAEYPIVLRRHLLPSRALSPLVKTKFYQHTVPGKFHCQINAPQIICLEQGTLPLAIQYLCIADQKPVRGIRTQLIQIELYRCQSVSKSDVNMQITSTKGKQRNQVKFVKRTVPAFIHYVDTSKSSVWRQPIVVKHKLHPNLSYSLDSPLVGITHQIEVAFQFEHRFETIRAKIPITIASTPIASGETAPYPFETSPRVDVLPNPEPATKGTIPDEESLISGANYSVIRDQSIPPARFDNKSGLHISISSIELAASGRPPPDGVGRTMKKFASAFDLCNSPEEPSEIIEERPRTTTPSKGRARRRPLPPIDVELANAGRAPPIKKPESKASSDALPSTEKSWVRSTHNRTKDKATKAQQLNDKPFPSVIQNNAGSEIGGVWAPDPDPAEEEDEDDCDTLSIYSDTSLSSKNAPSLSSSATGSSANVSRVTLQSRPESPVLNTAPGLPSAIPLQSHEDTTQTALVEESFIITPAVSSPALATVASSTVLTPRTTQALRRQMRPSTDSSLKSDTIQPRESSLLDPESEVMRRIGAKQHDEDMAIKKHYLHAKLPPIPTAPKPSSPVLLRPRQQQKPCDVAKRMTKLYIDDSDDEALDPLPPIPERRPSSEHGMLKITGKGDDPPKLPRLSFGISLGMSLGLD